MNPKQHAKRNTVLRVIAFLLIVALVYGALTRLLTINSITEQQYIRSFYLEPKNSLDVMILGASETFTDYCAPLAWQHAGFTSYPLAVSAAPVGADVEQVRPLHPAMARRLAQADCGDLQPFELWTLRESWFKLTGAGDLRTIPFRRTAGVLFPPEAGALCRVYDAIPGCAAAACSLAEQPPERLQFVPPREICT